MRGSELLDKMELIDPAYIEAAESMPPKNRNNLIKWGIAAACFCVLLSAGLTIPKILSQSIDEQMKQDEEIINIDSEAPAGENDWVYNNRLYSIGNAYDRGNIDTYGLPWPVNESSVGDQYGYVYQWDGIKEEYIRYPVYDYLPIDAEAVKIASDQAGGYYYITFLSYQESDESKNVLLFDHLREFYGLTDADDIDEIIFDTGYTDAGLITKHITDRTSIESFYNSIKGLQGEWYNRGNEPESKINYIKIRLKNGLEVFILYYIDTNCFGSGNILYEFSEDTGTDLIKLFEIDNK